MQFKYPALKDQFPKVDQRVQNLLAQFEMWSVANSLPEPMVTHVFETQDNSEEIFWKNIQTDALAKGEVLPEPEARKRARAVFSFHKVNCAVDLRDYIYTPEQYGRALAWLRAQVTVGMGDQQWEVLGHNVGSGHHFHIGFRDMARYHEWQKNHPE